jgi:uncharacterized protein
MYRRLLGSCELVDVINDLRKLGTLSRLAQVARPGRANGTRGALKWPLNDENHMTNLIMRSVRCGKFGFGVGLVLTFSAGAAQVSAPGQYQGYSPVIYDGVSRSSLYVPTRDGTRLAIDIFRPTRAGEPASESLPVIWMHTPYNRRLYGPTHTPTVESYPGYALGLVKYGYNVAVVDFRGLYASFGQNRGYNRGEWVDAARYDAYDVTEWLAHQPWSSGRVGMWGCSATGGSQLQAATTLPPSLKAIMPMSAEFDAYPFVVMGGVQFPPPGPEMSAAAANAARDANAIAVDGPDGAALLTEAIATHRDNVESPGSLPYRDSRSPSLDLQWWRTSSPSTYHDALQRGDFGVYVAANWDEAGTKPGSFYTLANLPAGRAKLIVGPRGHCQWNQVQEDTGFSILTEELRFFDHWLKGIDNHVMDQHVTYYTYNAPKGEEWRSADTWPLASERLTKIYFGDRTLTREPGPRAGRDRVAMSEAAKASVIKIERQDGGSAYETEPLTADMEVTGNPVAHLWIRTQARDALATVWIDDVAPDDSTRSYQMLGRLLASDRALARAPYDAMRLPWHSFLARAAHPLEADKPTELIFELVPMSYLFKAGHRVRVTVTFTDPRGQVEGASPVEILRGGRQGSYLLLPIIPQGASHAGLGH